MTRVRPLFVANAIIVDFDDAAFLQQLSESSVAKEILIVEPNRAFAVALETEDSFADDFGQQQQKQQWMLQQQQDRFKMQTSDDDATANTDANREDATEWNIDYVKAPAVWEAMGRGEGMVYANSDTGVLWQHEALRGNYLGVKQGLRGEVVDHNYAWWDGVKKPLSSGVGPCGINSQVPCDDNGHGTHTTRYVDCRLWRRLNAAHML